MRAFLDVFCCMVTQACSMAASPLAHLVAVGTTSGHLYIVDANKTDDLRLIHRCRLHQGPLDHVA